MDVVLDTARLDQAQPLFGLSPLERHLRALRRAGTSFSRVVLSGPHTPAIAQDAGGIAVEYRQSDDTLAGRLAELLREGRGPVLVLDAATVVDPRLVDALARSRGTVVACCEQPGIGPACAMRLETMPAETGESPNDDVAAFAVGLLQCNEARPLQGSEFGSFITKLRRDLDFYVFHVPDEATRKERERWLFEANYKGSTDFLTKWVYPPLVWPLVRASTRFAIHPNWITILSIAMTFAAIPYFMAGTFWTGLALAYAMSVLDSVDGKVARLTLTDSRLGDVLDHGLDIIHPPLWYLAWGWGVAGGDAAHPAMQAAWIMTGFYVLDRVVLGIAKARFGRGLHAMTALDGGVRTFIARRNVNLVVLTVGLVAGLPGAALLVVTAWQALTALWHSVRTVQLWGAPVH